MSSLYVLECCIVAYSIVIIGVVDLGLWLEPNKTIATGQHGKMAPYHTHASPLSQPPKSNFRVRAKEPSCPNEKALNKERRPFSREAELTVANKRHDRDEIGSPESVPGRKGGTERWWGGGGERKRDTDWQRETHKDKWDHEKDKGNGCGQVLVQGQQTGIEMKRWYYRGRRWKTELSLGVIRGLILTAGLKKPSVRVKRTSPHSPSIIKPHPRNHNEIFTTHVLCVLHQFKRLCLKTVSSLRFAEVMVWIFTVYQTPKSIE